MMTVQLAHLVTTGLGPVYDGIGHFLLSPDDLIPVVALALFAGLRGKAAGRGTLFCLPLAWLIGGLIGLNSGVAAHGPLQSFSFMLVGVLIAADLRLPPAAVGAVAVLVGAGQGFFNGVAFREAGPRGGALELIGIWGLIFVVVALVAAFIVTLRTAWTRIVVRVAGSWIAAIGLLMLGWALRPGHG